VIVAPAVDVRAGRCVQWVGGRPERERISLPDPIDVARTWCDAGFATLHVVDLDAALRTGDNLALVRALVPATPASVQVGGGVRDDERAGALLDAGADRIIVGTRAVDDRAWLESLAAHRPRRVMVAADARDGRVLHHGWRRSTEWAAAEFLASLDELPLAGVLFTDVSREGGLRGVDLALARHTVAATRHPVWFSGGIRDARDLEGLEAAGAAGAVVGMALYTRTMDAALVARRWGGRAQPAATSPAGAARTGGEFRASPDNEEA